LGPPALTKALPERAPETTRIEFAATTAVDARDLSALSQLPIGSDGDGSEGSRRRLLLAVYGVRRRLERLAGEYNDLAVPGSMAVKPSRAVRELLELIAALDRRVPQVQRAGEMAIAQDAASLKERALKRIEEIKLESQG